MFAASGSGLTILTNFYFEEDFAVKVVLLATGACLLTAAHLLNRRLCRDCPVC